MSFVRLAGEAGSAVLQQLCLPRVSFLEPSLSLHATLCWFTSAARWPRDLPGCHVRLALGVCAQAHGGVEEPWL